MCLEAVVLPAASRRGESCLGRTASLSGQVPRPKPEETDANKRERLAHKQAAAAALVKPPVSSGNVSHSQPQMPCLWFSNQPLAKKKEENKQ